MISFLRDVMGLPLAVKEPGFAEFGLPDGDKVEVFGPGGPAALDQFASGPIVAGFLVGDIAQARQELIDAGVELIGPLHTIESGYAWQHFRGPDGNVYELTYDPARP
jgi:catechol 2,3-dioxygenase-like lactoylglutathione lyase family enzyme